MKKIIFISSITIAIAIICSFIYHEVSAPRPEPITSVLNIDIDSITKIVVENPDKNCDFIPAKRTIESTAELNWSLKAFDNIYVTLTGHKQNSMGNFIKITFYSNDKTYIIYWSELDYVYIDNREYEVSDFSAIYYTIILPHS